MQMSSVREMAGNLGLALTRKPALVGVAIVLVLVAVIAAGRLIGTATANDFSVSAHAADVSAEAAAADQSASMLFVHVSGEVNNPGLIQVQQGGRVADAVQAAGGFSERSDVDAVNLARPVQDGEHIHINAKGDSTTCDQAIPEGGEHSTGESTHKSTVLVNINQATEQDLVALPGVGESTAQKIISDRQANGPFESIEDLKRVSGIGERKFETLRDLICI